MYQLKKPHSISSVTIENIPRHLFDLHLIIPIPLQRKEEQLEGRAVVGHNKKHSISCKRTIPSSHQTHEEQAQGKENTSSS